MPHVHLICALYISTADNFSDEQFDTFEDALSHVVSTYHLSPIESEELSTVGYVNLPGNGMYDYCEIEECDDPDCEADFGS